MPDGLSKAASPTNDPAADVPDPIPVKARVEVRSRFDGRWCGGFEVAEHLPDMGEPQYRLRRLTDGTVLPAVFIHRDLLWDPVTSDP
jgi:hypothetical protein